MALFPNDKTIININNGCCSNDIKDQLDRIESKLDQLLGSTDDEALRQEIWDKLEAAITDIKGTIT